MKGIQALFLILLCACAPVRASASTIDFDRDIQPILAARCLDCHGDEDQSSGFRLDQRPIMLRGGDSGMAAVVPGDAAKSHLIAVLKSNDEDERMPPNGESLTREQIALFEQWIAEGAVVPGQMDAELELSSDLWSLQPVVRPEVPVIARDTTAIDAFLLERLGEKDLAYGDAVAARSLIRRVSVVLTGLMPTPERVSRFIEDSKGDDEAAYTGLVDELLASPSFGERWAQHWLDVIRWAESNGSEANLYRKNAWVYRDFVIAAFNEDRPYDQFVREQIAGDQYGMGEATGFLVAGPHVPAATVGQEPTAIRQARADRMDEIMQTVGSSLLGMTVSCARCHNHKFDPITIQDYYSLTAVFQGVEFGGRLPELSDEHPRTLRANELLRRVSEHRAELLKNGCVWEEDWGGFRELQFPATRTSALRIEFDGSYVAVDELELFGPGDVKKNLALASSGTQLTADERMTEPRGDLRNANDGEYGTQTWRARSAEDSSDRPWVEIRFPRVQEVSRLRLSSNRESYFETDYIADGGTYQVPGYRVSAQHTDGTWREIASNRVARTGRLHELIQTLSQDGPRHSFIGRFQDPVVTRVFSRGSPENPAGEVMPAGFAILDGDLGLNSSTPDAERRKRFADWVFSPEHPLTARVYVNRVWHHLFGAGIVATTSDFGKAGAPPSHPELLDWLAAEFVHPQDRNAKPWSTKDLIRRIVLTDAFRQSSAPRQDAIRIDANNSLLWRFSPQRVEAEVIRDSVLQASGKLDRTPGGRSYRIHGVKNTYAQWQVIDNHGPETWRRMIYQERMRRVDDRIFTAFDFPDCGQVSPKRPISTTPLQALNLMNSEFVVEQSEFIAQRAQSVSQAFELLLTRAPTAEEFAACEGTRLALVVRSIINSNEFAFLP
ncbi:MAG: PSD1 and planctomycete cytochrome C domain-containing protein [Planctomycetia bacterium]|nr:PSD1 and planctomycete cytochrome C domain-containing protein [Planctomycetia bacterium]